MKKIISFSILKLTEMRIIITTVKKLRNVLYIITLFCSTGASAADYYWVGGSGNWSDIVNHWATSSGGSNFHTQVPGPTDNVFFDANSFTAPGQVVTVDQTIVFFHNMDWTGAGFNPEFSAPSISLELNIFGSLTLITAMDFTTMGSWVFQSNLPGNTITSAGHNFQNQVQFNGVGGGWALLDELNLNGAAVSANTGFITLVKGTLNTNGQNVNCLGFNSNNTNSRALLMDNSQINLNGGSPNTNALVVWNTATVTNFTLSATGSTIIVTNLARPSFRSGAKTYHNLIFSNPAGSKTSIVGTGTVFNGNVFFAGDGTLVGPSVFNGDLSFNSIASIGGVNICNGTTTLSGNSIISSSNTFNGILNLAAGKTFTITPATTQTIGPSGILNATGTCTSYINIESSINGALCNIQKLNGDLNIDQVVLQDINAIIAPGFFANATNSVDAGNNPGWDFPPATGANMFWIGGSGSWNDPNHWSLTSGGAAGTCIPGPGNDVFFDNGSGFTNLSKTVTLNINIANCNSMNWTGAASSPVLATTSSTNQLKIFGSLTLIPAMTIIGSGILSFESRTTGKTITTAGRSLPKSLVFNGVGGYWTLADGLTAIGGITLNAGILNTNNQSVNVAHLISSNSNLRSLILGSSILSLSGAGGSWTISGTNFSLDCGTSTLRFLRTSSFSMTSTGNFTYHNINFESSTATVTMTGNSTSNGNVTFAGNGVITGSNIFNGILTFSPGKSYTLASNQTQTISSTGTFNATGTCGAYINIESDLNGSQSTINKVNGNLNVDNGAIQDIMAIVSPGFSANATNKSTDAGGNTGWNFSPNTGINMYWIGGTGNWTDANHWSTSSGGAPGSCIPGTLDDVFFDVNSFTPTSKTVTVNTAKAYCHNMNWTGANFTPLFQTSTSLNQLKIYGSLILNSDMSFTFDGIISFDASTVGHTITSAGTSMPANIYFNGLGGGWTLSDDLTVYGNNAIVLNSGNLNTNSQNVSCYRFFSSNSNIRTLELGSSIFTITGSGVGTGSTWLTSIGTNLTLMPGTSTIRFTNPLDAGFSGGGKTYNNISFENSNATNTIGGNNIFNGNVLFSGIGILSGNGIFNGNVSFSEDASITGTNTFNRVLKFSQGKTYTLTANLTQTFGVNGSLNAIGTPCFPIAILSSVSGIPATLTKAGGEICADYLFIVDCRTSGTAIFKAGIHSNNVTPATNTGWQFVDCSTPIVPPVITSNGTVFCGSATLTTRPAASYLWSTGETTQSINVSNSGTYTLTIVNFTGCSETGAITITINPDPACSITGLSSVCSGTQPVYDAPAGMIAYLWSVSGDASIEGISTGQTATVNVPGTSSGGSFTVTLTVTNSFGCSSTCTSLVTVNAAPTISCPGNQTVDNTNGSCNAMVTYSSSPTGTPAPDLTYVLTGATTGNGNGDGSGSVFNTGITTVTLTATNSCGTVSCSFTVTVVDNEAPNVVCQNISVSLLGGFASITPYQINNGSSDNCGIASISVSPNSFNNSNIGNNPVTLTVMDVNGNVNTCTAIVTINSMSPPEALCKNISVTLVNGIVTITPFEVDNGSSAVSGIQSLALSKTSFDCSNIGVNRVTLTVTDNNNLTSTCESIVTVIGINPTCTITVTPSNTTYTGGDPNIIYLGYGPQSVTLRATGSGGAPFTYSWNGSYLTGTGDSRIFNPIAEGNYNIEVTTTNIYGCVTTCTISICVLDIRSGGSGSNQKVYLCHEPSGNPGNPQILSISVNAVAAHLMNHPGDRLGQCNQNCEPGRSQTGGKGVEENRIKRHDGVLFNVYPSPNTGKFVIDLDSKETSDLKIEVIDILGRIVYTHKRKLTGSLKIPVNLEGTTQGLYIVRVEMNGQSMVKQIILTR